VRLKGGDPYIFGRGSEEAAALQAAGIPFEVIPGITAATAAGEYAGFSFTHRDISSAVAFITGHEDPLRVSSRIDYRSLAGFPGTLVFYMGLGRLKEICQQLREAGMSDSTPAAIVCQASLPSQLVVEGTLMSLPALANAYQLKPPSLIVVGDCVTQRATLSWFEQLPLFGLSIGVTRPEDQADDVADRIIRLGGEPVIMPMIDIRPVPKSQDVEIQKTLSRLPEFQWIVFTSVNGVAEFFRHLRAAEMDARALHGAKIAVIGSSTAQRIEEFGIRADLVPNEFRAEALATALVERAEGEHVLWVRASRGRDVLPSVLAEAGITFESIVVYENRDVEAFSPELISRLISGQIDWIALSSPSIARRFSLLLKSAGLDPSSLKARVASISPVTTAAATECALTVAAEASQFTWDGILNAIQREVTQREISR
jgi:uroporphyrinogen III methyltransferase/synthase